MPAVASLPPITLFYAPSLHSYLYTSSSFFFFNDTAPTEIYTLSLHDALPIFCRDSGSLLDRIEIKMTLSTPSTISRNVRDRKSTRLNSSHVEISYAVFCLKKKKNRSSEVISINIISTMYIHNHICPSSTDW